MEAIDIAQSRTCLKHGFYATPMLSTPIIPKKCGTAATNMKEIFYDPDWFKELDLEEIIFVLCHEVLHILLKHELRRGTRHHRIWNVACDVVINRILVEGKVGTMPPIGIFDKEGLYKGMSEEQIYDKLLQQAKSNPKKGKGKGPKKGQQGAGSPGDEKGEGGKPEPGEGSGGDQETNEPGEFEGISGLGDDWDGDLEPLPADMTKDEIVVLERAIDGKLAQAAAMGRLIGKMPGELERILEQLLNPAVPWQDLLRDYMTRVVHEDESWNRRNRRFYDVYLPAKHNERMAGMTIIGDTSGSIGPDDYARIATEIKAIIEDVNPEFIRVVWADTRVAGVQELKPEDFTGPKDLKPKGGGGTDMRVPLEKVVEYDPPIVVLITDGYTPWPDREPPYPLIVVCTTGVNVPIGDVVRV